MQLVDLGVKKSAVGISLRSFWRPCAPAAALSALCAALPACGSADDLGGALVGDEPASTGVAQSALDVDNGLDHNGLDSNGLDWNGLDSNGLYSNGLDSNGLDSNGLVTSTIQTWLQTQPAALGTMRYLVRCAAPTGATVRATVNGTQYSWPGAFGLAPGWMNNTPMTLAEQEWVSACLLAHVNLAGRSVMVSFRSADATIPTTAPERSTYNCREAAFMGNLFGGRLRTDALPLMQCRDSGAQSGTGRSCDPSQGGSDCVADCATTCAASSGPFSSCSVTVNGTQRTYGRIVTTYLPTDSAQGCLGWGYDISSRSANLTSGGATKSWSFNSGWNLWNNSCSGFCGGYAANGCSCAPDCASKGTCCGDAASQCGTPPPYVPVTSGQSTCPSGYTTYTGSLSASGAVSYWPSSSGYTVTLSGAQHATLLGPSGVDFDLSVELRKPDGTWVDVARSERGSSDESIHYFYGKKGLTYRWRVLSYSGTGSYKLCMNDLRGSTLANLNSGKCIGPAGAGVTEDTAIVQSSCVNTSYQGFRLQSVSASRYTLANVNSGKCLDVRGGSVIDGAPVIEWFCAGTPNQQWDLLDNGDGTKSLRSVNSGKCLDVYGGGMNNGAPLVQWACNGGTNQRFRIQ